jgi:hypothetical protein
LNPVAPLGEIWFPKLLLLTIEFPAPDPAAFMLFASFCLSIMYSLIPIEVDIFSPVTIPLL